jgi:DNA-binding transcriptional ArsR family regulator
MVASRRRSLASGGPVRPGILRRVANWNRWPAESPYGHFVSGNLPFVATYQADGLTALGDPTRRAIFERLAERPRAVGELASELPVSRPAVSQHLKLLKDANLVVDRHEGTRRIYQLDPDGIALLRTYLDRFWSKALAAYKEAVEQPTKEV